MGHESVAVALAGGETHRVNLDGVITLGASNRRAARDNRLEGGVSGDLPGTRHLRYIATAGQHPSPEDDTIGQWEFVRS